ncbi:PstS family phosphate ABC transporter substrate-binding protein [Brasilonema sp. UFV-L1]|uniref:PstS family phosphate ABC transporter substrate-binding protein n=1 Tax=Brasilonema sp. UFV-L1 TaxID=2234130 RepID=UPI00145E5503|nr:PstS family phosphate ABC transporter substrate-binding protein [Brasilonema sp. UFV-L1]NMG08743.1 ABC transporter substrate-binding protein [Brasilonema sp. UFV-L1]
MNTIVKRWTIPLGILVFMTMITAIIKEPFTSAQTRKQTINIDGSSTVYPITKLIAAEFNGSRENPVQIKVGISGTTGGFRKFCEGKTDISDASRPILKEEMAICNRNKVGYIELPIAFDALTVVVNPKNDWAKDITIAELQKIWEPAAQGKITKWNQIRSTWPDKPLNLYGADKDSGTFDYFTQATVGKRKASRTDYTSSEDDNVLVRGVSQDPNALGYFGIAYYEANTSQVKVLGVDNGKGPVLPSRQTVEKTQYQPLSRPLFIYINSESAQNKPEVKEFVDFYLEKAAKLVGQVGYIPLSGEVYHLDLVQFHQGEVGTVFNGEAVLNLTLSEVLRKRATLF